MFCASSSTTRSQSTWKRGYDGAWARAVTLPAERNDRRMLVCVRSGESLSDSLLSRSETVMTSGSSSLSESTLGACRMERKSASCSDEAVA